MENRKKTFVSESRRRPMEWADSNVRYPTFPTGASPDRLCRPSDPLATICLEVYASFELQPTLGAGEQLRELAITVKELLDCSAKDVREWVGVLCNGLDTHPIVAFTLPPIDGDVVSPCSSILVTAKHWRSESHDSSASKILNPHCVSRRVVSTRCSLISVSHSQPQNP